MRPDGDRTDCSPTGAVQRALGAIDRAVALLDRGLAEPYRVQAFLKARPRIAAMADAELAAHVEHRTLQTIEGVGSSIAALIDDAVNDRRSPYLERLDAESRVEATPAGAAIQATLRGDLHAHTDWSDGGAPIEVMAAAAAALGHEYLAVTDHSGRLTVARGLDRSRLAQQLDRLETVRAQIMSEYGIRVLAGVEVDINEDGSLDGDDEVLAQLDIVVASVHVKQSQPIDQMTDRILRAVTNPHVDVLGHCTGRKVVGRGRKEITADWDAVFGACAANNTAVEINCRPERLDPPRRLLRQAIELGCHVAIDTDAHAPGQLEWQAYGCNRAADVELPVSRIINSWDWTQLQSWTRQETLTR
jgi:putative hydrolase